MNEYVTLEERNKRLWRVKDTMEAYQELHKDVFPTLSAYAPVCGMQTAIIETLLFSYVPEDKREDAIRFMEDVAFNALVRLVNEKTNKK